MKINFLLFIIIIIMYLFSLKFEKKEKKICGILLLYFRKSKFDNLLITFKKTSNFFKFKILLIFKTN